MQNTLSSLAILAVRLDTGKDYIETFVPFIVHLFNKMKYATVEPYVVSKDFEEEYGLKIPPLAMLTILTRTKHRGYIREENKNYIPVRDKIIEDDFNSIALDQERKFRKVVSNLIKFAEAVYNFNLTERDADETLVAFLRKNDLAILFAKQNGTALPEVQSSRSEEYVLCQFIIYSFESDPEIFRFIVDIAIGHIIASTILYNNYNEFQAQPESIEYYFDIGILFSILGINGPEREAVYKDLLSTLRARKAKLKVFNHTVSELDDILQGCKYKIEHEIYDPRIANRSLKYFKENGFTPSRIQILRDDVPRLLRECGIETVPLPGFDQNGLYQIDEDKLHAIIVEVYRDKDPDFNADDKKYTISLDVDSISAINRLRRGKLPKKLREAVCAFITPNTSLAIANKRFETTEYEFAPTIPAVLTDIFLGTFVWLGSPIKVMQTCSEKRVIALSYAAIQPTEALCNKLLDMADQLKNDQRINNDEYILLRESSIVELFLAEKTLGDVDRFNDRTTFDILEEINAEANKRAIEAERKLIKAEEDHQFELQHIKQETHVETIQKNKALHDLDQQKTGNEKLIWDISSFVTVAILTVITFLVFGVIIIGILPSLISDLNRQNPALWIISLVGSIILNILSTIFGWSVIGMKTFIQKKIVKWLSKRYIEMR